MPEKSLSDLFSMPEIAEAILDPTYGLSSKDHDSAATDEWAGSMLEAESYDKNGVTKTAKYIYNSVDMDRGEVIYNLGIAGRKVAEEIGDEEKDFKDVYEKCLEGLQDEEKTAMGRGAKQAILAKGFNDYQAAGSEKLSD